MDRQTDMCNPTDAIASKKESNKWFIYCQAQVQVQVPGQIPGQVQKVQLRSRAGLDQF